MALMQVYNENPEDEPVFMLKIERDEPPLQKFHYKPLSDPRNFRILYIEPGAPGSRICGSLHESRLGDGVTYLALSYVWGSPQIVAYVMVENCYSLVTENLYAALQHLRSEQEPLYIWIDQICINQEDQEERSQQVMLMQEIFSKSVQVLCWLGKDTQPYEEGLLYILKLLAHTNYLDAQLDDNLVGRVVEFTNSHDVDEILPSLSALYENRWFLRSWTFQEAVCNSDTGIITSFVGITLEILISFTQLLMENDTIRLLLPLSYESYRATRQLMVMSQYRTSNQDQKLLQLAHSTRDRGATDLRDRLYSLISIAASNDQQAFTPHYGHSTARVYTEFASSVIQESNRLDILEYIGSPVGDLGESDLKDLPSWVPDWSLGWFPLLSSTALAKPYAASKVPDKVGEIQESELIAYGMKADKISTIASESYWPGPDQSEIECLAQAFRTIEEITEMVSLSNLSIIVSEKQQTSRIILKEQQGWCEALIDSQLRKEGSDKEKLLAQVALYIDVLNHRLVGQGRLIPKECLTDPEVQESFSTIHRQFERMTHAGRNFCTTKAGRLGWASKRAMEGDIVALLYGSTVPILLRPRQDGKYECLEACYIHGMMDGEVVEEEMIANGIPDDEMEDETKWKQYAPMERFVIV
ncbi:hypothetical protein JMJ35_009424 [Cladonia borealis]|uniref:Heterokaryon incompatibility domain-containing protein n=1 Tax=Cladonia borealis TaxID=184061 RepID=A0AA39QUL1_9LECA|nr:hypothetical protein JMJ35_009424 [Cladonia borealis]